MHVRALSPIFAAAGAATIALGCASVDPPHAPGRGVEPLVEAHRAIVVRDTPVGWLGAPGAREARAARAAAAPKEDDVAAAESAPGSERMR
jgi:hypothetical protein